MSSPSKFDQFELIAANEKLVADHPSPAAKLGVSGIQSPPPSSCLLTQNFLRYTLTSRSRPRLILTQTGQNVSRRRHRRVIDTSMNVLTKTPRCVCVRRRDSEGGEEREEEGWKGRPPFHFLCVHITSPLPELNYRIDTKRGNFIMSYRCLHRERERRGDACCHLT